MGRARTWVRRSLAAFLVLVVLAVAGVAMLWYTETGARWVFRQLDARAPGTLAVVGLEGTLRRGLRLQQLAYDDAETRIEAREVRLLIDWPALLDGRLQFNDLQAASLRYRGIADAEPRPLEVRMPPVPLPISAVAGRIGHVSLAETGVLGDIHELHWSRLELHGSSVRAENVQASAAGYAVRLDRLHTELSGPVPVTAALAWSSEDGTWSGQGPVGGSLEALEVEQEVAGPYPAVVHATARVLGRVDPEFSAQVQWQSWTVAGYAITDGTLELKGVPEQYLADYRFAVAAPAGIEGRVSGNASGHLEGLTGYAAELESGSGNASATGELSWLPTFAATAQVQVRGLDPALLHPELSGGLDGQFGLALDESDTVRLSDIALNGTLNGAAMSARGDLDYSPQALNCRACELSAGANTLLLDGRSTEKEIALRLDLRAPALDALWPGLSGSLEARGHLVGAPTLPRFRGTVSGTGIRYADAAVQQVTIESRTSGVDALDADFSLSGLTWQERELGRVHGTARGAPDDFELEAHWRSGEAGADAVLGLKQSDTGLAGVLRSAEAWESRAGEWTLQAPATFAFAGGELRVSAMSWRGQNGRLDLQRLLAGNDELTLAASLEHLPLSVFDVLMPAGARLSGTASAEADLALEGGAWTGAVDWRQEDTVLQVERFAGEFVPIRIPVVTARVDLADGGATATAAMAIEPGVSGELRLSLERLAPDTNIRAELDLDGRHWEWLPVIVPQVDRVEGAMTAHFEATGPLRAPELSGRLDWRDGSLVIPELNIPLTGIALQVEGAADGSATVTGSAQAGAGRLELEGRISDLLQPSRTVNLRLQGDTAALLNWPDYQVWASPDLVIQATAGGWDISGDLRVPRAEIAFRDTPEEAVVPSPDVVVIGEEAEPEESVLFAGQARLQLGESVHVKAFGLDTRLEGELLLRQPRGRPLRAEGQVTLAEGVFEAYGQRLTIEEGTLTFTGPLDNPVVDVRAVRKVEAFAGPVTAGIHLTGRALALNATIFSEPAMAEAEALSYLVLGQPLSQASSSEGSQLSSAALGLGLRQANRITGQIGRTVGLDQLTLTGAGGEGTALVAGKQINDRLYARYAYGVFSRLGTLLLRYRLSKRLTLEAGTGESQTIDLLYTVEKP